MGRLRAHFRAFLEHTAIFQTIVFSGFLGVCLKAIGFLKEVLLANYFGVSTLVDYYVLAMMAATFFVGPVAGTFGTLFTQKYVTLAQRSVALASKLYFRVCLTVGTVFFVLTMLKFGFFLNIPNIIPLNDSASFSYSYLNFLLPIIIMASLSSINKAVFVAQKRFVVFSLLPSAIPISIVIFLLLSSFENLFKSLVIGTVVGYAVEFILGFLLNWRVILTGFDKSLKLLNTAYSEIILSFKKLFTAKLVLALCLIVDQSMAFLAGPGSISVVNYGTRIPLGLISVLGIVWAVLFPTFSELVAKAQYRRLLSLYSSSIFCVLIFLMSFSWICLFYSELLVTITFERGEFKAEDSDLVGKVQGIYFLYIPFYVIHMISIRLANSFENQGIIFRLSVLALFLNVLFNLIMIDLFGVVGISYATVLSYMLLAGIWIYLSVSTIYKKINIFGT